MLAGMTASVVQFFSGLALASLLCIGGCKNQSAGVKAEPAAEQPKSVMLSIVGTNDIHGALDRLPIFAGFLANLRARRAEPGPGFGGVALIDAGDMFQGTLESNLNEGAAMVDALNALDYTASVVGNHEFDFGPVGPDAVVTKPEHDPRGALRARLAQARFPILAANYLDAESGRRVDWEGAPASVMKTIAGVQVGTVGVSTFSTPFVTMASNVVGIKMAPLAETITREARALRERGAKVVIVTAHAGGRCDNLQDPDDRSSCVNDEEIMSVAKALPPGLVDVIVGGHTHRAMAHRINGIAIIESYSRMRAFGRVDLRVTTGGARAGVEVVTIHPPRDICPGKRRVPVAECQPGDYEGAPVRVDDRLRQLIAPAMEAARVRKDEQLGVTLAGSFRPSYGKQSALGNLIVDLMRAAHPTDVAITNGGGLRATLPAGPLTYGSLYESTPFDNRFATVTLTVADLERVLLGNLQRTSGILSISGGRARATCVGGVPTVEVIDESGRVMADDRILTVGTSDFLSTGAQSTFGRLGLPADAIEVHDRGTIRDAMAEVLRKRGGRFDPADPAIFDPHNPRIAFAGARPFKCSAP